MNIVILGLSITSSWGNGHATTYRGVVRELIRQGHDVLFLERDAPWYAGHRDMPRPPWGRTELYSDIGDLRARFAADVAMSDLVVVGSYVPQGVEVGHWVLDTARGVRAFYDIDTPVTLAKLARGEHEYLSAELIPAYDLYLSFTGGPILERLEREFGSPRARPLYCSADPEIYYPEASLRRRRMGYLGTYSADRQPALEELLLQPARQRPGDAFVVAGSQYPIQVRWPVNVEHVEHLPPPAHRAFYTSQQWTLNITRRDMIRAGYSPSVRLFEAGACGTPVVSDVWDGIGEFFVPGEEIVLVRSAEEVLECLEGMDEAHSRRIGAAARERVLEAHTAACRARELIAYAEEAAVREAIAS